MNGYSSLIQKRRFNLVFCILLVCQVGAVCAAEAPTNYTFWHNTVEQADKEAWHLMGSKPTEVVVLTNMLRLKI
jgi:hypothetical protein